MNRLGIPIIIGNEVYERVEPTLCQLTRNVILIGDTTGLYGRIVAVGKHGVIVQMDEEGWPDSEIGDGLYLHVAHNCYKEK